MYADKKRSQRTSHSKLYFTSVALMAGGFTATIYGMLYTIAMHLTPFVYYAGIVACILGWWLFLAWMYKCNMPLFVRCEYCQKRMFLNLAYAPSDGIYTHYACSRHLTLVSARCHEIDRNRKAEEDAEAAVN